MICKNEGRQSLSAAASELGFPSTVNTIMTDVLALSFV
jgi:hypothetical protein